MASFEAIEDRHAQVVIYQDEAKRLSSLPQFDFVEDRNKEQRKMWVDLLNEGIEQGCFRPGHRRRPGVPVHPRHHLGFGALVSARRTLDRRRSWPPVPFHRPRRNHRQQLTRRSPWPRLEAYVIDAVRTAVGKRNGSLAGVHPIDLGAAAFRGIFDRVDVDPGAVDDVDRRLPGRHRPAGRQHRPRRRGWPPDSPKRCPV